MDFCFKLAPKSIALWCSMPTERPMAQVTWKLPNTDILCSITNEFGMGWAMVMTAVHKVCSAVLQELKFWFFSCSVSGQGRVEEDWEAPSLNGSPSLCETGTVASCWVRESMWPHMAAAPKSWCGHNPLQW